MIAFGRGLYQFLSGFGIPAIEENSVPDNIQLPYITYSVSQPDWRESASISVSIWYSDTGYKNVFEKADEISKAIGEGLRYPVVGGYLWFYKETPFMQTAPTTDDNVKVVTLNIGVHALVE